MKKTDEMIKMSAGELLLNYNVCGWITMSMYGLQCQRMNYNVNERTTMSIKELQCQRRSNTYMKRGTTQKSKKKYI